MNIATPPRAGIASAPDGEPHRKPDRPADRRAPRLGVTLIATAAFAAEMAVSGRYGYVRDELYFLTAGHHPAAGYVDQPVLTPLLARLTAMLTGNTLVGLRMLPALCLAVLVVLAASMTRTAGGSRAATVLAALATAVCSEFVGAMHELTTTTPDFVFWGITLLLVMRLLASRDPRYWMAIGLAAGLGGAAKWNIAFLVGALVIGFAVTGDARPLLRSRYLLIGGVALIALFLPDLIWQAAHGWPNADVFRHLQRDSLKNRLLYWPAQLLFTGPVLVPVWIAGLRWLLRGEAGRAFRPLGITAVIVIVLQFVLGGKPYYAGGIYTCLFAAGAIAVTARPAWTVRSSRRLAVAMIAGGLVAAPIAIPVLPARFLHTVPLQKINYDLAETIAWPREVALVAAEYRALPARERSRATILAGNYGEAGALARYGSQFGLPAAYSGANSFWFWGPPPAPDTAAIAIGVNAGVLRAEFAHVVLVATFGNGLGVDDDEQGTKIYAVSGLKHPWSRSWAAFRHFG